jgi:protein-S-isoprenylcysteine O-methyltransferase Ste14
MRCLPPRGGSWGIAVASWSNIARRIRVPLGFALAAFYLWAGRPTGASILLGAVIAIPGLAIRGLASGHLQKNEQLATTGPYARTRNPLYLGSLVLAAGFAVAGRSWWIAIALILIFLAIYIPVIRAEEAFLRGRFPQYAEYASQVPRLLPRLSTSNSAQGKFSWDLYWKHREYNATLGFLGMMTALAVKLFWVPR